MNHCTVLLHEKHSMFPCISPHFRYRPRLKPCEVAYDWVDPFEMATMRCKRAEMSLAQFYHPPNESLCGSDISAWIANNMCYPQMNPQDDSYSPEWSAFDLWTNFICSLSFLFMIFHRDPKCLKYISKQVEKLMRLEWISYGGEALNKIVQKNNEKAI